MEYEMKIALFCVIFSECTNYTYSIQIDVGSI